MITNYAAIVNVDKPLKCISGNVHVNCISHSLLLVLCEPIDSTLNSILNWKVTKLNLIPVVLVVLLHYFTIRFILECHIEANIYVAWSEAGI